MLYELFAINLLTRNFVPQQDECVGVSSHLAFVVVAIGSHEIGRPSTIGNLTLYDGLYTVEFYHVSPSLMSLSF